MRFAGGPKMAAFMTETPNYGEMGDVMQKGQSMQRQTATQAEGYMASQGLDAMGKIKAAEFAAEATIAAGNAQASATRAQGMQSMIGSIAGGVGSMDFGPKADAFQGNPGSVGVAGFGNTPNTQVEFGYNGGEFNGFGTYGPNWGY